MKKRNVMLLVILLVIGFATVSTSLLINGTIGIGANEDDFDVIFTEATINGEDATATIDETKKKITFTSSKLTSVGEKAILDYKVKNNSTQYDADVTINCTNEASEFISVTNELAGEEITEDYKTTFTAQEEKSGVITAELIKSATQDTDSIEVTCTIVASAKEKDSAVEIEPFNPCKEGNCTAYVDHDNDRTISIGDEVTYETESFYIYNTENDELRMLSKYNLEVGNSNTSFQSVDTETNLQSPRALGAVGSSSIYGVVFFASDTQKGTNYSTYEGSIVDYYIDIYATKLPNFSLIAKDVTAISIDELKKLGCDDKNCANAPAFVSNRSYWTKTSFSDERIYAVYGNLIGTIYDDHYLGGSYGVRPAVIIDEANI